MPRIYVRRPLADRLFEKVKKTRGCWLWTASVNNKGYGQILLEKTPKHLVKLAHRVSWELANGPIPLGLGVLHKCDTPTCVNPAHLFLGTQKTNTQDAIQKGRIAIGERQGLAKLTDAAVREIRQSYRGIRGEQGRLAKQYGVSRELIGCVLRREIWKHV